MAVDQVFSAGWTLHVINGRAETLTARGGPTVWLPETPHGLRETIKERTRNGLRFLDLAGIGLLADAELLAREVSTHVPDIPLARTEAGPVHPHIVKHHFMRLISRGEEKKAGLQETNSVWDSVAASYETYKDVRGELVKLEQRKLGPVVRIADLSSIGRRAVHLFDNLALERVFRAYTAALAELSGGKALLVPPPRKFQVFVSYRKPKLSLAERLHTVFDHFGNCAFFTVFLDVHDTKLGDWWNQYAEVIENSDLFVPLCTSDYAEPGSTSRKELDHALAHLRNDEIAPVAIDSGLPPVWAKLKHLNACILRDASELAGDNPKVQDFVRCCLSTIASSQ